MVRRVVGEGDVWCQFTPISLILADHFSENSVDSAVYAFYGPVTGRSVGGCPTQLNPQEISDVSHAVILKFPAHVADLEDWAAEQ